MFNIDSILDQKKLVTRVRKMRERQAISPIIATLLLILIAIAAGVVVYAYVLGYVGNSQANSGGATSIISISNFCVEASSSSHNCNGAQYFISLQNVGSASIASGSVLQMYFTDINSGNTGVISCTVASTLGPASSASIPSASACSSTTGTLLTTNAGDTVTVKVVAADGGTATSSVKVIA